MEKEEIKQRPLFPFAAIVGQERVKRALLIAMVNVRAGGVLIAGEIGTGKSTLVRSLKELAPDIRLLELPLSATEDMVLGSLDMEYAVLHGQRRFMPGLLTKADGHRLYIDDINLLRRDLLNAALDTAATGVAAVERDGVSFRREVSFAVIGTMNPEEGILPPAVLDRFGLFVLAERKTAVADRMEIVKQALAFEKNPAEFARRYREETQALADRLSQARELVGLVVVTEPMMQLAARLCADAGCAGHRAEIFLLEAAKALAALAGRDYLLPGDLEEAAYFVLPHRSRREEQPPPPEPAEPPEEGDPDNREQEEAPEEQPPQQPDDSLEPPPPTEREAPPSSGEPDEGAKEENAGRDEDRIADIEQALSTLAFKLNLPQERHARKGSGKRSLTRSGSRQGRYVRAGLPKGAVSDLAFDATLRAAAPYQRFRGVGRCAVNIHKEDLRQKIREKRIGSTFLFVVDASGSMGAKERMRTVKGAIFAMLQDAYQKRDQVGMIAFRRRSAEVLLPVTRSVDLAQKCLRQLPTGGKTPLAEGLTAALDLLHTWRRKDKDMQPVLILVTDGRANAAAAGGDPVEEAVLAARRLGKAGIVSVVIDTETDFIKLGLARNVAREMDASYYSLRELSERGVLEIVRQIRS